MEGTTLDHLYLVSTSYVGRSGFYEQFYLYPEGITIARDTDAVAVKTVDCIVVPCANPYGLKSGVPAEIQPLINDRMEQNVRNYIFSNCMGEQPIGSAFIVPYIENVDSVSETRSSSRSKDKARDSDGGSESTTGGGSRRMSKRATPTTSIGRVAHFVCWVAVARKVANLPRDYAYSGTWTAVLAIKSYNKSIAAAALSAASASSSKDKSASPVPIKRKLASVLLWAPSYMADGSDMAASVYQTSLAVKNFMNPPLEPYDDEAVERMTQLVLGRSSATTQEREKELDGLLFSRELESRGLCNEEELDILINWVNTVATDARDKHSLSAARAIVSLLRRPDTEFTLRAEQICEKVISKTGGCLTRLLEMGHKGEIELHREIPRSELEIAGKVGDGNAGSVYRAKYKGMDVAVKMFTKGSVQNSQDFIRELSLLSLIQHPLIVNCYGGSSRPGDEYIVEELMEASVYDLLHDKKFEMDMEMKLDFAISTAKCMNFLHSCGVIHRDLKSLNLLVSKTYQVKVCDFGLSRVIDSKNQMTSNIGTVSWVAPELFAKKLYTEKADVYSYGIILWELLSRQMPFGDIEAFSVPLMVSRGERPDLPKDAPLDWRKLIKGCWHQKPTSRPSFKKILIKLRSMLQALRDEKTARGESVSDRGLFIRNSQFLQEENGASSEDHKNSSSQPYPSDSKSESEASSENLNPSSSTLSISTSMSTSTTSTTSKHKKRDHH
jgi:serine/threonine protein kinase